VAGAGGSLLDPGGNTLVSYAWGLGRVSNNIVESYALYKGICIARERNITNIEMFGDSMMVVQAITKKKQFGSNIFNNIVSKPCPSLMDLVNLVFIMSKGTLIPS
jgi:ribonuclease HI